MDSHVRGSILRAALLITFVALGGLVIISMLEANGKLRDENAALKKEISDWRLAIAPAVSARDWWKMVDSLGSLENIKPKHLDYLLNPCYKSLSGDWDTSVPQCGGERQKGKTIPIAIVRLDHEPLPVLPGR